MVWGKSGVGGGGATQQSYTKGPCSEMVDTLPPECIYRDYVKADVYTIWVHGPLTYSRVTCPPRRLQQEPNKE